MHLSKLGIQYPYECIPESTEVLCLTRHNTSYEPNTILYSCHKGEDGIIHDFEALRHVLDSYLETYSDTYERMNEKDMLDVLDKEAGNFKTSNIKLFVIGLNVEFGHCTPLGG